MANEVEQLFQEHTRNAKFYARKERMILAKCVLSIIGCVAMPIACLGASITLTTLDLTPITAIALAVAGGVTAFLAPKAIISVTNEYHEKMANTIIQELRVDMALLNEALELAQKEQQQEEQQND